MLGEIRDWLFRAGANRDGRAEALEELAVDEPAAASADADADDPKARRHRPVARSETILVESLSQKVLDAWLRNRQQTLYPLTMNFRTLEPAQVGLLIEAMAAAMTADGEAEASEREQTERALGTVGADSAERDLLGRALAEPRANSLLFRDLQDAGLGAYAYAASLLALNQRSTVNRLYLDYLAARLAVPAEVVSSLNRRYRM